jgi:putative intracellular protease/amidase
LVTDSPVAYVAEMLAEPFIAADIRCFAFKQYDSALHWLRTDRRMAVNLLVVLTSHDQLGNTGRKTGFWLEELAAPYYVFQDAGASVTLASPKGGQPPLDPMSNTPESSSEATRRFTADVVAQTALANTRPLSDVDAAHFDAVFYPGGHGPLWDLATFAAAKPLAAVCHAPGIFRHALSAGGEPVVKGKAVTGFSNTEEHAVGLGDVVPFRVEDMLIAEGGSYSKSADWQSHVVTDGLLITGQNPASSAPAARALLDHLRSAS